MYFNFAKAKILSYNGQYKYLDKHEEKTSIALYYGSSNLLT